MLWTLLWQADAVDDLIDLMQQDPKQARRVRAAIVAFGRTGEGDVKALRGRSSELRLRVGNWRVILENADDLAGTMYVSRIHLRRDAYD